jgi:hypothetical protein
MSVAKKPVVMQAPPSTTLSHSNVDASQINEVKEFVKNEIAKYSDMLT